MAQEIVILPRPDYRYTPREPIRILPRENYRPKTLHTLALPAGGLVSSVEAEWCPICLSREIGEQMKSGRPVWHCRTCGNEW